MIYITRKALILYLLVFFSCLLICVFIINKLFPTTYLDIVTENAHKNGLSVPLVLAVIDTESGFNEFAVSNKSAYGLMQLMEPTALWIAKKSGRENFLMSEIFKPEENIALGTFHLGRLYKLYGNDERKALAAYNAGEGNVSKWAKNDNNLKNIPFRETKSFVTRVLVREKIYTVILFVKKIFGGE